MKIRQSGMPEVDYWNSFFKADELVKKILGAQGCQGDLLELGAGYGTFTMPAARQTTGLVTAYDIEPELVEQLKLSASNEGLNNIQPKLHNFVADGIALADNSQTHVMLYNLLHLDNPQKVLSEARRVLKTNDKISIIHWRSDIETPRGPSLDIRPTPDQSRQLLEQAGFKNTQAVEIETCAPYHYGLTAKA